MISIKSMGKVMSDRFMPVAGMLFVVVYMLNEGAKAEGLESAICIAAAAVWLVSAVVIAREGC